MFDMHECAVYDAQHGHAPDPVNETGDIQMSQAAQAAQQANSAAAHADPARRTIHIVLHEAKDTVGVAVVEGIEEGTQLNAWIMDADEIVTVPAKQGIPIGHKVALKDMAVGDTVYKYGVDIGKVVAPIKAGEHAHVHNIKTKRW
jgi:(2R)-sulfolactate sulfo-lyase subunit alpha